MSTPSKDRARAERLREHAATVESARDVVSAMGRLVRGREARARESGTPLEIEFARVEVDGRALPAAVWVALRRDDVDAAIEAMTAASQTRFMLEEREVIGEGFRLESVQDSLPLPEPDLLAAQLARMLDIPVDVLAVIVEWGPDDPRTESEIDDLLSARFGAVDPRAAPEPDGSEQPPARPLPVETRADAGLRMTVPEVAQVLRLDDAQVRALEVLVRNAAVTLVRD